MRTAVDMAITAREDELECAKEDRDPTRLWRILSDVAQEGLTPRSSPARGGSNMSSRLKHKLAWSGSNWWKLSPAPRVSLRIPTAQSLGLF